MIDVALLSVIRRWHFREGVPIREITRRTGLSRNTVRKYLASGIIEPSYPKRTSPSKLDDYECTLISWLFRESKRHRKQRRSIRQLHSDLVQLGYTGSYDRVAAYARQWQQEQQEAQRTAPRNTFVPLQFAPGEAFQFDWSEDYAVIAGVRTKLQIAHFKVSFSRAFFLRAYLLQTHEMLFDAHYHAFCAFEGVPERGIYDNMKTAVDKVRRGKDRGFYPDSSDTFTKPYTGPKECLCRSASVTALSTSGRSSNWFGGRNRAAARSPWRSASIRTC